MGLFGFGNKKFSGNTIDIVGNRVLIDGVDVTDQVEIKRVMEVHVLEGTIENLRTDASVTCGDITGPVRAGGSVDAHNIGGSVDASGSVECAAVHGDVRAGGSVDCHGVGGSVKAGGNVYHR